MLTKLIHSDSFMGESAAEFGARLFESTSVVLRKQASTVFGMDYSDLKPDDKHVGIHLVALGDAEHFGANRNADAFPKEACIKFHDTFVKYGHVFRHHKNTDPSLAIGKIIKSAYNEPMGRIELFIHADKEKAAPELARLAKEGTLPDSMSCTVPFDVCRICGGHRKSANDSGRCEHLKDHFGETFADGKQASVDNTLPKFFDISFVTRPADRIAWDLYKAASAGTIISSTDQAEAAGVVVPDAVLADMPDIAEKVAVFRALAAGETVHRELKYAGNSVHDYLMKAASRAADVHWSDADISELRKLDPKVACRLLADKHVILEPDAFFKYAFGLDYGALAPHIASVLDVCEQGVCTCLTKTGSTAAVCAIDRFDVDSQNASSYSSGVFRIDRELLDRMNHDYAIAGNSAEQRIFEKTANAESVEFAPRRQVNAEGAVKVAAEWYAAYKVAAVKAIQDRRGSDALMIASAAAHGMK